VQLDKIVIIEEDVERQRYIETMRCMNTRTRGSYKHINVPPRRASKEIIVEAEGRREPRTEFCDIDTIEAQVNCHMTRVS
jgi:hypothetical protein